MVGGTGLCCSVRPAGRPGFPVSWGVPVHCDIDHTEADYNESVGLQEDTPRSGFCVGPENKGDDWDPLPGQRYNSRVTNYRSVKEAKDFLADRIVDQARRENAPLSEIERKMLYFSETDWTLPDMETVSAEFDRDYDRDEYEQKIARLIAIITADRHHQNEAEEEKWDAAVEKLSEGDHYIQVLISQAEKTGGATSEVLGGFYPTSVAPAVRPPNDILKLVVTAFAVIFAMFGLNALTERLFTSKLWLATGWDLSDRAKSHIPDAILVCVCFLAAGIWRTVHARSSKPKESK
jgi:hypothetical protein